MTIVDAGVVANYPKPTEVKHLRCDARATSAGSFKPKLVDVGAVVKSPGEDDEQWLDATQAERDSVQAPGALEC